MKTGMCPTSRPTTPCAQPSRTCSIPTAIPTKCSDSAIERRKAVRWLRTANPAELLVLLGAKPLAQKEVTPLARLQKLRIRPASRRPAPPRGDRVYGKYHQRKR